MSSVPARPRGCRSVTRECQGISPDWIKTTLPGSFPQEKLPLHKRRYNFPSVQFAATADPRASGAEHVSCQLESSGPTTLE